jgi:hypothetical protein
MAILLQNIVALLTISNPPGALPVFLAITEHVTPAQRCRAGLRAAFAATTILDVAASPAGVSSLRSESRSQCDSKEGGRHESCQISRQRGRSY